MRSSGRMLPALALALGVLGCALGGAGLVLTWGLKDAIGRQLDATLGVASGGVGVVHDRLQVFDGDLDEAAADVAALSTEIRASDPAELARLEAEVADRLFPDLSHAREELGAIGDVVRAVAGLLGTMGPLPLERVPRFGTERHEGLLGAMESVATARGRLDAEMEDRDAGETLAALAGAVEGMAEPVRAVRELVGPWRQDLAETRESLRRLRASAPRTLRLVAVVVSLLILLGVAGQVCLARSGLRGLGVGARS